MKENKRLVQLIKKKIDRLLVSKELICSIENNKTQYFELGNLYMGGRYNVSVKVKDNYIRLNLLDIESKEIYSYTEVLYKEQAAKLQKLHRKMMQETIAIQEYLEE